MELMNTKKFLEKIKYFFSRLTSEPRVGGLHISDSGILYADINGGLKTAGVKLPPGVVVNGKLIDAGQFRVALQQLHKAIDANEKKIIPVVVALPTADIYTQSFTTPNVGRERLEESALLNLQMISPMSAEASYMSWQLMQETPDQFELLGAFAEKKFVDEFRVLLEEARISPVVFEFPSIALSRLVALVGGGDAHPSLLFQVSSDGLNFSILRNNGLYFDYFRSWKSIQGNEKQITKEHFEDVVTSEIQKVMNFTVSKFKESPVRLFMVAPGFEKDVQDFIKTHFGIPIAALKITTWNVSPQWYVAIGAALRMGESGSSEFLINLASEKVGLFFYREQAFNFIRLWRGIVVGVLSLFFVLYLGSAYSLARTLEGAQNEAAIFSANASLGEFQKLEDQARVYNALVSRIGAVKIMTSRWSEFFSTLNEISVAQNVMMDRVDAPSINDTITLVAHTPTRESIVNFKNVLATNKNFSDVDLLVSQISTREDGSAAFQITFRFAN